MSLRIRMVLLRKGFYLELDTEKAAATPKLQLGTVRTVSESPDDGDDTAIAVAVVSTPATAAAVAAPTTGGVKAASTSTNAKPSLTTAEAIAAELAATEASRPAVQYVTFAPEALQPGSSIRPGKRKPGRNLSKFRSMASELFKS